MSDLESPNHPRWGFHEGPRFIPVPKAPLIAAGFTHPPFCLPCPWGGSRWVVEEHNVSITLKCPCCGRASDSSYDPVDQENAEAEASVDLIKSAASLLKQYGYGVAVPSEIASQAAARRRMEDALLGAKVWANAYPTEVFPLVDVAAVSKQFADDGLLVRLHAAWARHILGEVVRHLQEGLS